MARRDPLSIESESAKRARKRRIQEAIRAGGYSGFVSALHRRDILVERALRDMERQAGINFARHVEAPILRAVAGILGAQPEPFAPSAGVPPVPRAVPSPLPAALSQITTASPTWNLIRQEAAELAQQEVVFTTRAMAKHFGPAALTQGPLVQVAAQPVVATPARPAPILTGEAGATVQLLAQRAQDAPMLGQLVERVWAKNLEGLRSRVERDVGQALARGATNDEIVRMLRGTRAQSYTDGVLGNWRAHSIRTFVRTVGTHVSTQAREGTYAALGAEWVQFEATLDLRTTPECFDLDDTVWPIGEGPRPPIHPGCRSTIIPAWSEEGITAGTRASMDGPIKRVSAKTWFGTLSAADQDQLVGAVRGKALRAGTLTWPQLFGPGLQRLTLAQLRADGLLAS